MRLLLKLAVIALALSWGAHAGWWALSAPWHEFVPYAFWVGWVTLIVTHQGGKE